MRSSNNRSRCRSSCSSLGGSRLCRPRVASHCWTPSRRLGLRIGCVSRRLRGAVRTFDALGCKQTRRHDLCTPQPVGARAWRAAWGASGEHKQSLRMHAAVTLSPGLCLGRDGHAPHARTPCGAPQSPLTRCSAVASTGARVVLSPPGRCDDFAPGVAAM